MDWEAPVGAVCTCCDKPIPPRRPSLAARSRADRATIEEMRGRCRKYEGVIAAGRRELENARCDLEAARGLISSQALRIEELERQMQTSRSKKSRRRRSGGELSRLVHSEPAKHCFRLDANVYGALKDESASC